MYPPMYPPIHGRPFVRLYINCHQVRRFGRLQESSGVGMKDIFRFDWSAFDPVSGIKVAVASLLVFGLMAVTGETWIATGLVLLFAWLTNVPGPLKERIAGIVAFAIGAIALTYLSGWLGLSPLPNTIAIAIIGFVGTLALALGTRPYMVGYVVICWAIYGPFLVASTSVENCVGAIIVGTGAIILTTLVGSLFEKVNESTAPVEEHAKAQKPDYEAAMPYALTVAFVLGLTTYIGWNTLNTDPTMAVAGAFFVIGFDAKKTWVAGVTRVIGIILGVFCGYAAAQILEPGLTTEIVTLAALFMSFAAMNVNPGLFMFFFMFLIALGWTALDPETLNLTFWERVSGEGVGVAIAMLAIGFMQWLQTRRTS